jgi:hypothetical protein
MSWNKTCGGGGRKTLGPYGLYPAFPALRLPLKDQAAVIGKTAFTYTHKK